MLSFFWLLLCISLLPIISCSSIESKNPPSNHFLSYKHKLKDGNYKGLTAAWFKQKFSNITSTCECLEYSCKCCAHVSVDRIKLNDTVCTNLKYLVKDVGIEVTLVINGVIYYNQTVSVRNPPPACFSAPFLEKEASLCLKFYDINWTNTSMSGCVNLVAYLLNVKIQELKIGCFHLGNETSTISLEISKSNVSGEKVLFDDLEDFYESEKRFSDFVKLVRDTFTKFLFSQSMFLKPINYLYNNHANKTSSQASN